MKQLLCTMTLLLLGAGSASAAKYAGEAFALGVGGRPLGMGGAVVAGPFDASAPYWNPAGMNRLSGRYIMAMHAETFGSLLNHDYLAYVDARPRQNQLFQAFGFYVYYLGGGGIKITDLDPATTRPVVVREESHGDFLFSGAIAGKLSGRLDYGLSAKIIYRDIGTESGYGLTMDAGVLYDLHQYVTAGLAVSDVTSGFIRYSGKTFDTGGNTESIYPTVKPGLLVHYTYCEFTGRLTGSGDIRFEGIKQAAQYWQGNISLDTHYGLEIDYRGLVFGRAGFDIGRLTAGAGIDIRNVTVDFAYLHHDDLDETFRVSAGYRF